MKIEIICLIFAAVHFLFEWISTFFLNKKINSVCKKCLTPITEDGKHECNPFLTDEQLKLIASLVNSIKGESNNEH